METTQGEQFDAFFVPTSGFAERRIRDPQTGTQRRVWTPPAYRDEPVDQDQCTAAYQMARNARGELMLGACGGKARALAALHLAKEFRNAALVTMSRFDPPVDQRVIQELQLPTEQYRLMSDYLRRRLQAGGVSKRHVCEESNSTTIFEALIQMVRITAEQNELDKNDERDELAWYRVGFVTNNYNLPRAQAMLDAICDPAGAAKKLPHLVPKLGRGYQQVLNIGPPQGTSFELISAEEVLARRSARYARIIEAAEECAPYRRRSALEQAGATQIAEGTYGAPSSL
ncbi:hypothetical protein CO046_02465 [Candidatus Peregrinibacteria bacterium CG_4_9_14_0_2_um_filter_53_11]|nr:MAG: hypothetical protein CO046_02465 [Candidatus Peregrinibacteria bacterium CG_4_9_14_0_2_um_filter_53_11]